MKFHENPAFLDVALGMLEGGERAEPAFIMDSAQAANGGGLYWCSMWRTSLPVQNLMENLIWSIWDRRAHSGNLDQITMGLLFLHLLEHTERIAQGKRTLITT